MLKSLTTEVAIVGRLHPRFLALAFEIEEHFEEVDLGEIAGGMDER